MTACLNGKSIDTSKHYIGDKEERKQAAAAAAGSMFSQLFTNTMSVQTPGVKMRDKLCVLLYDIFVT